MPESLPFGLRDVKLRPVSVAGVAGTAVDLPNSRTFSFEEAEDFEELRGDDKVVTVRGKGSSVDWELESGGIALEAWVVLNGGTLAVTGTGATEKKTYTKKVTDQRPDFQVEGQSISESGGDMHCVLYRCKADGGLSGEFADGSFFLTSASGRAMPSRAAVGTDTLYDFVQNAAVTAISTT